MSFRSYLFSFGLTFLFLVSSCFKPTQVNEKPAIVTLKKIQTRGILNAVTIKSSTSYFIYKGIPLGFHYELLKKFTGELGVKLNITTVSNLNEAFELINSGTCDLIAFDLTITDERKEFLNFSVPLYQSEEVIVYRKNDNNPLNDNNKRQFDIHVPAQSSFVSTLNKLRDEMKISIIEENNLLQEDLIKKVASGEISCTMADRHIAELLSKELGNITFSKVGNQITSYAWAVNKNSVLFLNEINKWLSEFKTTSLFRYWYRKYYQSPEIQKFIDKYLTSSSSKSISKHDALIKKYAKEINWDWRLLAALIYQESQFQENLTSRKGAFGLMQMMPVTAKNFGIDTLSGVESQIRAGVKYIRYLDKCFNMIADSSERIKFILASYNSGPGHVFDAMRLAEKYKKNKFYWDNNVDSFMLKKAYPKYYRDPVVRHGYSRGYESFKFVNEVIERYLHYKNFLPA